MHIKTTNRAKNINIKHPHAFPAASFVLLPSERFLKNVNKTAITIRIIKTIQKLLITKILLFDQLLRR